jgi:hypothetical protein
MCKGSSRDLKFAMIPPLSREPDGRSLSSGSGEGVPSTGSAPRGRLRTVARLLIGSVVALTLTLATCFRLETREVIARSGRKYELLSRPQPLRMSGVGRDGQQRVTAMSLHYLAPRGSSDSSRILLNEAVDLLPLVTEVAARSGDSVAVLRRSRPLGPRWLPLLRSNFLVFRRRASDGDWVASDW